MNLRQLRAFVTVAEERQFTRAAARLGIAQSSLSAQIRQLEAELGIAVLTRTTRQVSLTDAGELLLQRARGVLAEVADMTSEMQQMSGLLSGRVQIGLTQTPGPVDVLALLARFSARHPAIELSVREDLSVVLAEELRADRLDLGILSIVEAGDCRGLQVQPIAQEELVLIVAQGHRLAGRPSVEISDLAAERLVVSPAGATIRKTVLGAARDRGVELDVGFETREVSRIRALVAAGLGVAVLPRSDAEAPGLAIAALPFTGAGLVHRLSLCWREDRRASPAARALLTEAQLTYQRAAGA
jgi:LysR family transcriptional activator of glutamate synthase operon